MAVETDRAGWRLIADGASDGITNMARDKELLDLAARQSLSTLRFYTFDSPWITLGYFQGRGLRTDENPLPPEMLSGINIEACQRLGVGLVIRPTGGKAVLHGHDLTVSFACPLSRLNADAPNVKKIYRSLAQVLIDSFNAAGTPAALGETIQKEARRVKSEDCFMHVSPNDIVHLETGQKIVGCALRVASEAVLMQCSIPIAQPLIDPRSVFEHANTNAPLKVSAAELMAGIAKQFDAA